MFIQRLRETAVVGMSTALPADNNEICTAQAMLVVTKTLSNQSLQTVARDCVFCAFL
jgi:hypothetical protein